MSDWWDKRTWRLIQTNLREIDMRDINAERVVADLKDFSANVLMINAAGIIASYPTKLPFHFQSPYLEGDSLQDIIAACHREEIRVIARTDFSKVRRPIYEMYPDWATVTEEGKIIDYNGDVQVCVNGDYQQTYALQIIEELVTTHDFDGIFFNMGGYQTHDYSGNYHGICHCENCTRLFREMFGLPLPTREDGNDPTFRKYGIFKQRTLRAHHEKVYHFIRELRPEICIANHREFGCGFNRMESNTALGRPLPHWQYSASDNTKWAVSSYPDMVSSNSTVDFIDFPYRHVAVSPHQQALRLAQNLANGGGLDYYLIGRIDNHADRSGFEFIKRIFRYHARHEAAYANLRSRANIALIKSGNSDEFRGWFRVLAEHHFLFDSLTPDAAAQQPWDKYQAVLLPDMPHIDEPFAAKIDQYVSDGGTIVAAYQPGFQDMDGNLQMTSTLACLGIERVTHVRRDTCSCYFEVSDKQAFRRLANSDLVFMAGPYVHAQYASDVDPYLKFIPPHHFGPPERCYFTQITEHPGVTVRRFGEGKTVYIPWQPGRLFYRQGYSNTSGFMADVLETYAGLPPLAGNLSPMIEVTWFEKEDKSAQLVHLVNGSGHFGVSFYEPVKMTDLVLQLPMETQPKSVQSLVRAQACAYSWVNGILMLRLSELGLFEAVQVR